MLGRSGSRAPIGRPLPRQAKVSESPGRGHHARRLVTVSVLTIWLASGCDSASFAPPPPDDLPSAAGSVPPKLFTPPPASDALAPPRAGVRAIAIVLARHEFEDSEILQAAARTQAGYDKVKLDIRLLRGDDLPAQQADLVHDAVALNPLAVILEPADPEDKHLAKAVIDAQQAGVPVLFLNRPISAAVLGSQKSAGAGAGSPASASGASAGHGPPPAQSAQAPNSPILVGAPSFGSSAKQLVDSAIRNAKNSGLDPKKGATLVINSVSDAFAEDRTKALRQALENAGIKEIDEVRFAYNKADTANKLISDHRKANTKAVLLFGLDSQCLPAIRQLTSEDAFPDHPFIIAGYVSDDRLFPFVQSGDFAALAEFNSNRLIRKAITAAASLAQGKELPQHIEIPVEFHDSPPRSGLTQHRGMLPGLPKHNDE